MNKFAPKSEFLKRRAISLHRAGHKYSEICRMLLVNETTIAAWVNPVRAERKCLERAISYAEKMGELRREYSLPTLAYVPHIQVTPSSKYRMEVSK